MHWYWKYWCWKFKLFPLPTQIFEVFGLIKLLKSITQPYKKKALGSCAPRFCNKQRSVLFAFRKSPFILRRKCSVSALPSQVWDVSYGPGKLNRNEINLKFKIYPMGGFQRTECDGIWCCSNFMEVVVDLFAVSQRFVQASRPNSCGLEGGHQFKRPNLMLQLSEQH